MTPTRFFLITKPAHSICCLCHNLERTVECVVSSCCDTKVCHLTTSTCAVSATADDWSVNTLQNINRTGLSRDVVTESRLFTRTCCRSWPVGPNNYGRGVEYWLDIADLLTVWQPRELLTHCLCPLTSRPADWIGSNYLES